MSSRELIDEMLRRRLPSEAHAAFQAACERVSRASSVQAFCAQLSGAARRLGAARRRPLDPSAEELAAAHELVEGWNPERWTLLESFRVGLVLSLPELESDSALEAIEEAFRYADEGEACALYRSLGLLPEGQRFRWRAGEGCRSNMRSVFEAAALDTPYPFRHFDDLAWNQAVIKCLFVGAPLWRLWGLDRRLSPELARMALDLADERRSAGRPVPPELWLCLGSHLDERGRRALEVERERPSHSFGPCAVALAEARAGNLGALEQRLREEREVPARRALELACSEGPVATVFRALETPTT